MTMPVFYAIGLQILVNQRKKIKILLKITKTQAKKKHKMISS